MSQSLNISTLLIDTTKFVEANSTQSEDTNPKNNELMKKISKELISFYEKSDNDAVERYTATILYITEVINVWLVLKHLKNIQLQIEKGLLMLKLI